MKRTLKRIFVWFVVITVFTILARIIVSLVVEPFFGMFGVTLSGWVAFLMRVGLIGLQLCLWGDKLVDRFGGPQRTTRRPDEPYRVEGGGGYDCFGCRLRVLDWVQKLGVNDLPAGIALYTDSEPWRKV